MPTTLAQSDIIAGIYALRVKANSMEDQTVATYLCLYILGQS